MVLVWLVVTLDGFVKKFSVIAGFFGLRNGLSSFNKTWIFLKLSKNLPKNVDVLFKQILVSVPISNNFRRKLVFI